MKTTYRFSVLVLLLVLAVLPGVWRGSGPAVAGASGQLIVLDWPGFDDKKFYEDFDKKYPDAAKVDTKQDDAAIYSAVKLGYHADIIHPYTTWLQRWVDDGLVEEIDVTKLANWNKIPESLKAIGRCGTSSGELRCSPGLNGKQYFIPWDVGFSSILYRTDLVKGRIELLGSAVRRALQGTYLHV